MSVPDSFGQRDSGSDSASVLQHIEAPSAERYCWSTEDVRELKKKLLV